MLPEKPLAEFVKIEKCLGRYGTKFEFHDRKLTSLSGDENDNDVFVILSGIIFLYRNDGILIGVEQAPYIWGLSDSVIKRNVESKLMMKDSCSGYYLSSDKAIYAIENEQCWRDAFCWLAWQNRLLELRDTQLIGHNAYGQIRAILISMIEWSEELRSHIGVMNYINQSTGISRSVVAEILSALRKGGYIEMDNGKLVSINRLPLEY